MTDLAQKLLAGDIRALARAATIVENRGPGADPLLKALFPRTGRALTIGITGAPGAGKSTFVDQLARVLRAEGKTVGIIAVDPTSPYSGGAILGDRIRMQSHHADSGVFIRSMATRGRLGGLAASTMDLALLLDAAGRDVILVETVGVGQDEVDIAQLAGVTLVVLVPGMGDDVQALKAGIMEIADVFIVNKADQPGADKLEREIKAMLNLAMPTRSDGWIPPIVPTVASEGKGIDEALTAARTVPSTQRAAKKWTLRLRQMFRDRLLDRLPPDQVARAAEEVAARRQDPYSIVAGWVKQHGN